MPEYTFSGPQVLTYPESRDARNIPLGTVEPGDVRDLDGPPDHRWHLTADGERAEPAAAPDEGSEDEPPASDPDGDPGAEPPAVTPQDM